MARPGKQGARTCQTGGVAQGGPSGAEPTRGPSPKGGPEREPRTPTTSRPTCPRVPAPGLPLTRWGPWASTYAAPRKSGTTDAPCGGAGGSLRCKASPQYLGAWPQLGVPVPLVLRGALLRDTARTRVRAGGCPPEGSLGPCRPGRAGLRGASCLGAGGDRLTHHRVADKGTRCWWYRRARLPGPTASDRFPGRVPPACGPEAPMGSDPASAPDQPPGGVVHSLQAPVPIRHTGARCEGDGPVKGLACTLERDGPLMSPPPGLRAHGR